MTYKFFQAKIMNSFFAENILVIGLSIQNCLSFKIRTFSCVFFLSELCRNKMHDTVKVFGEVWQDLTNFSVVCNRIGIL